MQTVPYLFLTRKWEKDKQHMSDMVNYFKQFDYPLHMLYYPEGTDFAKRSKENSDRFAAKNGLPIYNYVLHPRTTGFQHMVTELGDSIDCILDLTVAYPINVVSREVDLACGEYVKEIHLLVRRYDIGDVPSDPDGLVTWCNELWAGKEKILEEFYRTQKFPDTEADREKRGSKPINPCYKPWRVKARVLFSVGLWMSITLFWSLLIFTNLSAFLVMVFLFMVNLVITHVFGGFQMLELATFFKRDKQS